MRALNQFVSNFVVCGSILLLCLQMPAQQRGAALLHRLGYPPDAKLLIVHADDVGMSHSVNIATFEALEKGYVSAASIMVPCAWFGEAAEFARSHPEYDFGLHLTLTSEWRHYRWRPVALDQVASLVDPQGYFPGESGPVGRNADPSEAARELQAQITRAQAAGVRVSHLDNHMGALSQGSALFAAYLRAARQTRVPALVSPDELRAYAAKIPREDLDLPVPEPIGPDVNADPVEGYRVAFSRLGPGLYYTAVHLGYDDTELRAIMLTNGGEAKARQSDLDTVSDPRFREALQKNGISIVSWEEIARRFSTGVHAPAK